MTLDKKTLEKEGAKYGIQDITDEEYEANKKYSVAVALHRIANKRKGVDKAREREIWKAIPLGGRDFVYKGISLEESRTQFISCLVTDTDDEGQPEIFLTEATQWGHFKHANHGDGCELEVERSETVLPNGDVRENQTVRKVKVLKEGALKDYDDIAKSGIKIYKPEEIDEDYLYDIVALEGEIGGVEEMPDWGTSEEGTAVREGDQPLWVNEQPCMRLRLKSEEGVGVNINLSPTRLAKMLISWPDDFTEILKGDTETGCDIQEALVTLVDLKILAVGCVRRCRIAEEDARYVDIDATAIFIPKDAMKQITLDNVDEAPEETPEEPEEETPEEEPAQEDEEETPEEPEAEPEEKPKEKPKAKSKAKPKEKKEEPKEEKKEAAKPATPVEGYKLAVADLMETLGKDDLTVEDVRSAAILPENLTDELVAALIGRVQRDRSE